MKHTFHLRQAFPPKELLQVDFFHNTATTITFKLVGPKDDGGLPINEFIVQYWLDQHTDKEPDVEIRKWPAKCMSDIS